ncbi:phosphatidylserine/phosphatidylglycerophosphate/cardiolipin synthase family protein [Streptomyces sp. NPDC006879]|uniref:phospholipase D-like domain-containing protein n=1 Tax=Streptomyces sp. NPDC006879 TaxID=3364767 RepID=UPI0036A4A58F
MHVRPFARLAATAAAVALAVALPLTVPSGPRLAPAAVASSEGFSVPTSPVATFNIPDSDVQSDRESIKSQLLGLIANAAPGSEIYGSIYLFNDNEAGVALIAARQRGVKVRVLMDDAGRTAAGSEYARLSKSSALGTDTAQDSFVFACPMDRGCIGNRTDLSKPPINHNKFFLFSQTAGVKNVVFQTSANLTATQLNQYYNNAVTISRVELYDAYRSYWKAQLTQGQGAGLPEYASTTQAGPYESTFFPRAEGDPVVDLLGKVDCARYPGGEATKVRVAMFAFTRPEVAQELVRLRAAGCSVYVYYNGESGNLGSEVRQTLMGGGLNSLRICRSTATDEDGVSRNIGIHSKYLLVEGTYDGLINSKVVFTGSHNYTFPNLRGNDETLLKIKDPSLYGRYEHNFDEVLNGSNGGICTLVG